MAGGWNISIRRRSCFRRLGSKEGAISIEDGTKLDDELETVDGSLIDRGYPSPLFVESDSHRVVLDEPRIMASVRWRDHAISAASSAWIRSTSSRVHRAVPGLDTEAADAASA